MSFSLQSLRSAIGRTFREARLYPSILGARSGKRIAFFPSSGPEQSGLLRAYNVADDLGDMGWTTLVVPKHLSLSQRKRVLRAFRPDICLLQTCRHPLNRIEHFDGQSVVLDLDDADFVDPDLSDAMADMARGASGIICGSRFIQDWAGQFSNTTTIIWTGTQMTDGPWPDHAEREPIVTWAQSDPVAYAGEFDFVVDVLTQVRARSGPFTLRLYGWQDGSDHTKVDALHNAGIETDLVATLPYEDFLISLRDAAVGLSPLITEVDFNKGKSFGKILGYLDAKVPTICSDAADNGMFFCDATGIVTNDRDQWVAEILDLLQNPDRRRALSDQAHSDFRKHLSRRVAAGKVDVFLGQLMPPALAHGRAD